MKTIVKTYNVERNRCIKINEFVDIINEYEYMNPVRLCFALLGVCGMRCSELCEVKMCDILEDFTKIKFYIKKKRRKYRTGTVLIDMPFIIRPIPDWLGKELKEYVKLNYHLFKNGKIFPFKSDSLRRYLSRLRVKGKKGELKSKELEKGLLDQVSESFIIGENNQSQYRISLHSFRRFYATFQFNTEWQERIDIAQRKVGHELQATTYMYLYNPEDIGLTTELKKKEINFKNMFKDNQQSILTDFAKV